MRFTVAVAAVALGVRAARSRHRRALHPAGRTFTGELEVWGTPTTAGSVLIDRPGRHRATVRVSKGAGARGSLPDVLGLAIRVHGSTGPDRDLLLSTTGRGRLTRHLPIPRRSFDTVYGSITPYRNREGATVYLSAGPDRDGTALGRTLASVSAAADGDRDAGFLLYAGGARPFGRVRLGPALPPEADAALAFDPVGNAPADLRPAGLLNATRAVAYRASRRWRGVSPAADSPGTVSKTRSEPRACPSG
ncbi:hypothetical protein QLQ12_00825 [Actinoplanes sp. NEAU-A12]|uniref:Phosphodiesterase n=1 Tax=Actinoplanes sandaracinus TaxID=3045177 RepID=A0ABT6WBP5_9ACTN|nr:hypothetical protein [Actinoplanes sandaracinus]MDI6097151.1 hypothetical protein [Actinoplanes sandaracinus]